MLADRIIATVRFFDLQDVALTAFEVHQYLIADVATLTPRLDDHFELLPEQAAGSTAVQLDTVEHHLSELVAEGLLMQRSGFYALPGRSE